MVNECDCIKECKKRFCQVCRASDEPVTFRYYCYCCGMRYKSSNHFASKCDSCGKVVCTRVIKLHFKLCKGDYAVSCFNVHLEYDPYGDLML